MKYREVPYCLITIHFFLQREKERVFQLKFKIKKIGIFVQINNIVVQNMS